MSIDISPVNSMPSAGSYTQVATSDRSNPVLENAGNQAAPSVEIPDSPQNKSDEQGKQLPEGGQKGGGETYGSEAGGESMENIDNQKAAAKEKGQKSAESEEEDELSEEEERRVKELKQTDREVRQHEQAHVAAAGPHLRGGPSYNYTKGPDGQRYATGGTVNMDTSREDTPEETVQKMRQVQQAAMAPADPSPEDYQVAQKAARRLSSAQQKTGRGNSEENGENQQTEESQPGEGNQEPERNQQAEDAQQPELIDQNENNAESSQENAAITGSENQPAGEQNQQGFPENMFGNTSQKPPAGQAVNLIA
ncbi:MAG: putative metalloprotease CJM1_0395 family protein [bacterium]